MVEPCATADVARSTADLLRIVARSPGQQELILTRAGRFVETLDSGQLARLAMPREVELEQERAARAAHIDDAGRQFQQDIAALTATLSEVAKKRSEEHTSELHSLMRSSYAVFCLNQKTQKRTQSHY